MAKSKEDIKYGTAQARLNEDDATRVAYKAGTPLESGKISDSDPVDLFPRAHNIPKGAGSGSGGGAQLQLHHDTNVPGDGGGGGDPNSTSRRLPKKSTLPPGAPMS